MSEGNELVVQGPLVTDLETVRPPAVVLKEAREAAKVLMEMIALKPEKSRVIIRGEEYLRLEDWQTIGRFYGVSAKCTRSVEIQCSDEEGNPDHGWEAHAEAIHTQSGRIVSEADSMCTRNERDRQGKRRWKTAPAFQIRSMSQTRAQAKALRSCLAFVPVLAGMSATPAEEMVDGELVEEASETKAAGSETKGQGGKTKAAKDETLKPPQAKEGSTAAAKPDARVISDAQRKRLYAIWKQAGYDDAEVVKWLNEKWSVRSTRDVLAKDYEAICSHLEGGLPLADGEAVA